jgi:hypothetical protein
MNWFVCVECGRLFQAASPFIPQIMSLLTFRDGCVTNDANPVLVKRFWLTLTHELLSEVWHMFCGGLSVSLLSRGCVGFLFDIHLTIF